MSERIERSRPLGSPVLRLLGTVVGVAAFCAYSRSWSDGPHLVYDITCALAVYSFLAQMLAEAVAARPDVDWFIRACAVAGMTVITVGREFGHWPISGHVTTVTATAIIQCVDARLPRLLRALYWVPWPLAVCIRVVCFDHGWAEPLWLAVVLGGALGGGAVLMSRLCRVHLASNGE